MSKLEEYKKKQGRLLDIKRTLITQIQAGVRVEENKKLLKLVDEEYLRVIEIINLLA